MPGPEAILERHVIVIEECDALDWVADILCYLKDRDLPKEDKLADRIVRQATMYCVIDGELYRKRESSVKLHCITRVQGQALLADIHEGTCTNHVASRVLAGKAFR
jgi:hypothetical protein